MKIIRSAMVGLIEILLGSEVCVLKGKDGEIHISIVRITRGRSHLQSEMAEIRVKGQKLFIEIGRDGHQLIVNSEGLKCQLQ